LENAPPHNQEAEQQILGAVIIDNSVVRRLNITPEDFYAQKHADIYRAMLKLDSDGMPIDVVTLKDQGQDAFYLGNIAMSLPTAANALFHADIVREDSNKRRLLRLCHETIVGMGEPIDVLVSNIRAILPNIVRGRGGSVVTAAQMAKNLSDFLERRSRDRSTLSGVGSGFAEVDSLTDGWQGGDLIILAARPGMGKSALAMVCAENAKVPVGVISIEMGEHQIGIRTVSKLSNVELWKLRKGLFLDENWHSINAALAKIAMLPIYFSFTSKNVVEIERMITQMVETYSCKMVIIDYLQLTRGSDHRKREQEVAEVSRLLKCLAQSFNIPIMAVSQLNREVEKRENKRPMLSDLRESGAIEQDADVVMFLYRDTAKTAGPVEIIFAKGRNIGLGTVKLWFDGDKMTFRDYREG
jgi:replicative DNA helicase